MATIKERKMTVTILGLVGILVIAACLLISVPLVGAETMTQGRLVWHMTKVEAIEVGDVPAHLVGVVEGKGFIFLEDGEIGLFSIVMAFDFIKGSGPHQGYGLMTYEDGSTQVINFQGTSGVAQAGAFGVITSFEGTIEYVMGTGRYEGIKGSGSYSGKRLAPPGIGADVYLDFTGTYTLPE